MSISEAKKKKKAKRVLWADHFGGELTKDHFLDGTEATSVQFKATSTLSLSDLRKRDREREKELLSRMK